MCTDRLAFIVIRLSTLCVTCIYYFFNKKTNLEKTPIWGLFFKACLSHLLFLLLFLSCGLFANYHSCASGALQGADDNQWLDPFHNAVQQSAVQFPCIKKSPS